MRRETNCENCYQIYSAKKYPRGYPKKTGVKLRKSEGGKPFEQMNLLKKTGTVPKNSIPFPQVLTKHLSVQQDLKITKNVTLKTWKTVFLNRKPQKV